MSKNKNFTRRHLPGVISHQLNVKDNDYHIKLEDEIKRLKEKISNLLEENNKVKVELNFINKDDCETKISFANDELPFSYQNWKHNNNEDSSIKIITISDELLSALETENRDRIHLDNVACKPTLNSFRFQP